MKKLGISIAISFLLVNDLSAVERMCFGQEPLDTSSDLMAKISVTDPGYYSKCKQLYPYFAGHVNFQQSDCLANADQISFDKGYAPLGVFFRGWESTPKAKISEYEWKIRGPIVAGTTPPVLATYEAFNAAYVFEEPGEYEAELTITDSAGNTNTVTKKVSVWERKGKTYYVDSVIGDDRYNGLSNTIDTRCNPETSRVDSCNGPWKTATRAFGELSPFSVSKYSEGKYAADNICLEKGTAEIVRYKQGNFKIFRSSTFVAEEALTDSSGNYLPPISTEICLKTVNKRETKLRPGDQVLFKRGQTFDLETGYNTITSYTATANGVAYNYERLDQQPTVTVAHWTKAIGVNFGAYGDGAKPQIKNTGKTSSTVINLQGVGMMGLSLSDLSFDLASDVANPFNNRATLLVAPGNPVNLVFNNIDVKKMEQGILANSEQGHGLFVFNSKFFDSNVTQFYSQGSHEDVALVGNKYDYSTNHLIYSSIDSGLIVNNELTRPAFGRTAFRLAGGALNKPNRFVWISGNKMSGWIDPRTSAEYGRAFADGKRYNYLLVDLSPNSPDSDKIEHDVVFTKNEVIDAETMLGIGAAENLTIKNNLFVTADSSQADRVILNQSFSRRPLNNINISSNKFIEQSSEASSGIVASVINLQNYSQLKCSDQFNNQAINIDNNVFYLPNPSRRLLKFSPIKQGNDLAGNLLPNLTLDQAEKLFAETLSLENNHIYTSNAQNSLIQIGGDVRAYDPKDLYATDWRSGYNSISATGGSYRLFNSSSQFFSNLGPNIWGSAGQTSPNDLINVSLSLRDWTWDEIIKFAEENGLGPNDVEPLIVSKITSN